MTFDTLCAQKPVQKGDLVKNPNARKVNNLLHDPLLGDVGHIIGTNAKRVILDQIADNNLHLKDTFPDRIAVANELREIIGRIPYLSIFVSDAHPTSVVDIRLKKVISRWTRTAGNSFVQAIGFSDSSRPKKTANIRLSSELKIRPVDIPNTVSLHTTKITL